MSVRRADAKPADDALRQVANRLLGPFVFYAAAWPEPDGPESGGIHAALALGTYGKLRHERGMVNERGDWRLEPRRDEFAALKPPRRKRARELPGRCLP